MTNTVVNNDTNTVVVQADKSTIIERQPATTTIVSGQLGPRGRSGTSSLAVMTDIDITNLSEGSILVYNETTSKWTSTLLLNKQQVDCGEF